MSGRFAIVTTTVGDAEAAKAMARALVAARLAACVQIVQIESIYRWQGAIEAAPEWRLACKIVCRGFSGRRGGDQGAARL